MIQYDSAFAGYVARFLGRHYWRVRNLMEYEDAQQEGAMIFFQIQEKYPEVEDRAHFMALFKRSWANHFTDLSLDASKIRGTTLECQMGVEERIDLDPVGDLDNAGMLAIMMAEAPAEIKLVLRLFLEAPTEVLELAAIKWRAAGRYRPEGDECIGELLGIENKTGLMCRVRKYFGGM